MDLASLINAYLIAQGSHTLGHFNEAGRQGIPINLHAKEFAEEWDQPNKKLNTDMDGGGFSLQDRVSNSMNNKDVSLMNAIIKAMYIAGVPGMLNKNLAGYGDNNNMIRESGNKDVNRMLGATILSDLIGVSNPDRDWNLGFSTFGTGQPGIVFNKRF